MYQGFGVLAAVNATIPYCDAVATAVTTVVIGKILLLLDGWCTAQEARGSREDLNF